MKQNNLSSTSSLILDLLSFNRLPMCKLQKRNDIKQTLLVCVQSFEGGLWFLANACVWICWRWGASMGAEWATMGTFYWKTIAGRRDRDRTSDLVRGKGWLFEVDCQRNVIVFVAWIGMKNCSKFLRNLVTTVYFTDRK